MECLWHFDGIVPSVASILTKQYSIRGGKYLFKTPENAISETQKTQTVTRCLSSQELGPLVQVSKPSTNHYQPATWNVLTALLTCLLDSACAKPNDSCKCWSWLSGVGILEWDIENDNYRLYWAISPQSHFHSTTDRLLAIRLSLQYKVLYLTYGK